MKLLMIMIPALLLSVSCMFTPAKKIIKPHYQVPEDFMGISHLDGVVVVADSVLPHKWWLQFNDAGLGEVIDEVIKNNLDLKLAAERVTMVAAQFKMSRAQRLPSISAGGGYNIGEVPQLLPTGFNPATGEMTVAKSIVSQEQYSLRSGIGFQLDIWGKYRSLSHATHAELYAAQEDLQRAYQGMVAQAIVMYYGVQAAHQHVSLSQKNVALYETNMRLQERRYRQGIGSTLGMQQTTQALAAAKIQLAAHTMQRSQKEYALAVLQGAYPQVQAHEDEEIGMPALPPLPQVFPSSLLKNRPDIRAAEFRVEGARHHVGAARADLFPSLSLSLSISSAAELIENLFSENTITQMLGVEVAQIVFAGGAKLAVIDQRKAAYRQAIINYKKTLLNAFKEVEDLLVQMQGITVQRNAAATQVDAAEAIRNELEVRYLKGLVAYDQLLNAEKAVFNTQSYRIGLELMLLTVRVQFFRAVGAGV